MFHKQLITGHRGSGKSTELKCLQARLRQTGYFAVYLDVETLLDLGDVEYVDVLVAMARAIQESLQKERITISSQLLKDLDKWFAEIVLTEEQRRNIPGTLQMAFGVDPKVPPLIRLLMAITGQLQSGGTRRVEIRRKLEQELRVFLQRLNDLIEDARFRLRKRGWKDLVVIVDGLEKLHYRRLDNGRSTHSALFVDHAEQLKAPLCHVIYTVPISLVFNVNLGDAFPDPTLLIPMVRLTESDGKTPYPEGQEKLFEVVARRVKMEAVFESRECVNRLIEVSGGSVRDLMRLIRLACYGAADRITRTHVEQAVQSLVLEYDRLVKDEHLDLLTRIAQERRVPGDETSAWLLHHRLVLEYQSDKRWADLHPAVRMTPRVQERLGE